LYQGTEALDEPEPAFFQHIVELNYNFHSRALLGVCEVQESSKVATSIRGRSRKRYLQEYIAAINKLGHSPARPVSRFAQLESWRRVARLRRRSNDQLGPGGAHPHGPSSHRQSLLTGARFGRCSRP